MFRNYLSAALRNLARNRLYAGITIAGLAVGFAAALLITLFVRDEYSYDKFIPGYQRVFRVSETFTYADGRVLPSDWTSTRLAKVLQLDFPQIDGVARYGFAGLPPVVRHGDVSATEEGVEWADPDFFRLLPVPVLAGDLAHALDAPDSVVIDRSTARKYFQGDAPIGQILLIDKHPMRVTAVIRDLPSNTHFSGDIFPSARAPWSVMSAPQNDSWSTNRVETYFRLKPGASVEAIQTQLPAMIQRHINLKADFPGVEVRTFVMTAVNIGDIHLRPAAATQLTKASSDPQVVAAIGAVGGLIVLVAAINFVTLMTARAARRAVEVGVRKAAGATRRDLIVQFMGEAIIYVLIAGVVGGALAELVLPAFNALVRKRMTFDYLHDPALSAGALGVVLVVAILAGAYPALVLSRFRPAAVLKGGPGQSAGGARVRQVLVVFQFAVLIGLIVIAGTIYRQTLFALNGATHLDKKQVMLVLAQPCTTILRDEVRRVPGVVDAACSSAGAIGIADNSDTVSVGNRHVSMNINPVDYGFFGVYRLRPLAGRMFDPQRPGDGASGDGFHQPVVINETAARHLGFANPSAAIGRAVSWGGLGMTPDRSAPLHEEAPSEIIGVAPDFNFGSAKSKILPALYTVPDLARSGPFSSIALNVRLDPNRSAQAISGIQRLWKRLDAGPMTSYFMDLFMLRLYVDTIVQGAMITASALVALSIACLGLFALSAYTTERRTKEIGIRKAMGASSPDILKLLLWQFTQPVLWANVIALPISWLVMNRWLSGFAYHISLGVGTCLAAALAAVLIAWATVFFHALRVSRARPVGALRYE